jgi:thioesterase domain-containing protein
MRSRARETRRDRPADYGRILVPIRTAPTGNTLFLVPSIFEPLHPGIADSQFFNFVQIIRSLDESQSIYGLRTVGLGGVSRPCRNLEELSRIYADAIISLQPHGPYRLVGHCLGGILAYEVSRQLSPGASDVALVLLDTACLSRSYKESLMPVYHESKRNMHDRVAALSSIVTRVWWQWSALIGRLIKTPRYLIEKFRSFIRYRMSSECRYWADCSREKMHFLHLVLNYEPGPFGGRLLLLVTKEFVEAGLVPGWDEVAVNHLEIHRIPGAHKLLLGEGAADISRIIKGVVDSKHGASELVDEILTGATGASGSGRVSI